MTEEQFEASSAFSVLLMNYAYYDDSAQRFPYVRFTILNLDKGNAHFNSSLERAT